MFFSKLNKTRTARPVTRRTTLRIESLEGRDLMSGFTPVGPAPISKSYNPAIAAPAADTEGSSFAPYNLTAKAVSTTEIDLAWNSPAQPGSAAYYFDICENIGGVWKEIAVTNQATSWKVTGLQGGTGYQFKVGTPDTQFGNGEDYSATAGMTTVASTLAPPANFAGRALSSSQVQLTWTPVAGATGYEIIEYKNAKWVNVGHVGPTSTFTVSGLSAATTNYFSIATDNVAGTGSYANSIGVYTPASVPAAPTGVVATEHSSSQVQLTWNSAAGATNYTVYYWTGSQWQAFGSTTGTAININVTLGSTYYFAVMASNSAGMGPLSAYAAITVR